MKIQYFSDSFVNLRIQCYLNHFCNGCYATFVTVKQGCPSRLCLQHSLLAISSENCDWYSDGLIS